MIVEKQHLVLRTDVSILALGKQQQQQQQQPHYSEDILACIQKSQGTSGVHYTPPSRHCKALQMPRKVHPSLRVSERVGRISGRDLRVVSFPYMQLAAMPSDKAEFLHFLWEKPNPPQTYKSPEIFQQPIFPQDIW
mmetsp:Transcript_36385/g.58927  ORF Transcript_36385/g.58927 Transcript_36385/m.58927 type:complete len:136 (-) Transcript_36385:608-1015(-)